MRQFKFMLVIVSVAFLCACESESEPSSNIPAPEGYSLVWNDEFDGTSIDTEKWGYETGDGTDYGLRPGWGNNELQLYTTNPENAFLKTEGELSTLEINAFKGGSGGYSSAKLVTKGKQNIRFGKIEVKAKLPEGQGIWPAIWLLGDNRETIDWPGCGEIDIAEVLGHEPSVLHATIHFTNGDQKYESIQKTKQSSGLSYSEAYHVFAVDWTPELLTFMVDDTEVGQIPIEDGMKEFLRDFYLILNVAVGGNWPGNPDATTTFPQSMSVDYVRVYSKNDFTPDVAPALVIEEETVGQVIEPKIGDNAIKTDYTALGNLTVLAFGGGGEPEISTSETAIDGDLSLVFNYPGGNWGGGYFELEEAKDISGYSFLKFSLNKPAALVNAEIKIESSTTDAVVFLKDIVGVEVANGFFEYSIPLSDYAGVNFSEITIPFSIWNPQDANDAFVGGTVLIDNLYFSN